MEHTEEEIICPNCGSNAKGNYCYQCGQETHLHKETFWGLVVHFAGHYFHYDSKFWQTLKALWFSPGKLTIAYMNKQRMRYIPPVSLYIFISAVYFLLYFSTVNNIKGLKIDAELKIGDSTTVGVHTLRSALDSLDDNTIADSTPSPKGSFNSFTDSKAEKIKTKYGVDKEVFVKEHLTHNFPKVFFFMIPVMALLLKLLFARRKNILFVDHAIFSLHYHSFWFSLFAINFLPLPLKVHIIMELLLFIIVVVYLVIALRRVYHISLGRALLSMITLGLGYCLFLGLALVADLVLIVALA